MDDLVSLNALPTFWNEADPEAIAASLGDRLVSILKLAWVCVQLNTGEEGPVELSRFGDSPPGEPASMGAQLRHWFGDEPTTWPARARESSGDLRLSIVTMPLGVRGALGWLAAASARDDFAQPSETLLLNVAANHAVNALRAAVNERLRKEVEERERREEELRRKAVEFQLLVDGIPIPLAITLPSGEVEGLNLFTPEGQLDGVNTQLLRFLGQTREEFQQHWATNGTVHADDLPGILAVFQDSLATGRPYHMEARLRRFDGIYRWFQIRGRPQRDSEGRIVRWYGLLSDIDTRKHAENALATRELEARRIVDNISTLVAILTPSGSIEQSNQQLLDFLGLSEREMEQWGTNRSSTPRI